MHDFMAISYPSKRLNFALDIIALSSESNICPYFVFCSSIDTSKRLRTITLEKAPANLPSGITVENKAFLLQRMADSRGSLQTSRTTLREFGESKL